MDIERYRDVLEDVQKDLAEVEHMVSELQGIERYVQRKMDSDADEGNSKLTYDQYQSLLEDVRQDVDGARSQIGELRGVGNFAREKLKAAGVQVGELKADKRPGNDATNASDETKAEKSPLSQPGKVDTMQTVEFGPNGFPK